MVNDNYRMAPWGDVLYAADGPASGADWWGHYIDDINQTFAGEKWTVDFAAAQKYGLNHIGSSHESWSNSPESIALGGNSGFQALNLAVVKEAPQRVILLGYDMGFQPGGRKHWFGDHPGAMNRESNYKKWVDKFRAAAPMIPVPVLNCTPTTALDCFPRHNLRNVL